MPDSLRLQVQRLLLVFASVCSGAASLRAGGVVINEIYYRPPGGKAFEFVEFRNTTASAVGGGGSATFELVEFVGVGTSSDLHVYFEGDGEVSIDDLGITPDGDLAAEKLTGGDFDGSASGWTHGGSHGNSRWQSTGGVDDTGCVRLIASGPGDELGNSLGTTIVPGLSVGVTCRVRLRVKMLSENTSLVVCLGGSTPGIGLYQSTGLGHVFKSPGTVNTVTAASVPPFVLEVKRLDREPMSGDSVGLAAVVQSVDPVASVQLTCWTGAAPVTIALLDDGLHADGLPGDDIYGGTLPASPD